MVAPVPVTSSSGWACTSMRRRAGSAFVTRATLRARHIGARVRGLPGARGRRSAMLVGVEYPELADRTGRFRFGAPHAITVGDDGARVAFLRSGGPQDAAAALWVLNVASAALHQVA